jgi:methionyl-tRNA formyltransferase
MNNFRIIFMGTPDFAVPSLKKLLDAGYDITAVITAPDKPSGRGLRITKSAVKEFALAAGLAILQPEKLKNPDFIEALKGLNADLQIVVAFRMLPEVVWNMPPMGTINLHGSLLPQYRGAAPINWAIVNGERETGVTTFKLKHEIDSGDILLQKKIEIGDTETAGELHDRMKELGAELLLETINNLRNGTLREKPQYTIDNRNLHHAPKISTETCEINWEKTPDEIYNLIRGLSPHPAAFTLLNGKKLKILSAQKEISGVSGELGSFSSDHKSFLKFACNGGYITVKELQLEGKKQMDIESFLRGWRIN